MFKNMRLIFVQTILSFVLSRKISKLGFEKINIPKTFFINLCEKFSFGK